MSHLNKIYVFILLCIALSCSRWSDGERIYTQACANCHMDDGLGVANLVPAIKPTRFLSERNQLICLLVQGANDSTSKFGMPSFGKMSNAQLANVLNYINSKQKFNSTFFNEHEIETGRLECEN